MYPAHGGRSPNIANKQQGPDVAVIIPAAGSGTRMGPGDNKVKRLVRGHPMLEWSLRCFLGVPQVRRIIVVMRNQDGDWMRDLLREMVRGFGRLSTAHVKLVVGGAERQESVFRGLQTLDDAPPDWVLVHDGARPNPGRDLVGRVLEGLERNLAVVPALPVADTLRRMGTGETKVVDRSGLYATQTPQGFHWRILWEAHRTAHRDGVLGTDDAQLVEALGRPVHMVQGHPANLKVTTGVDLEMMERIMTPP